MLEATIMRLAVHAFSTLFGSLGVFFVYLSFLNPAFGVHAVVLLTVAMGILRATAEA